MTLKKIATTLIVAVVALFTLNGTSQSMAAAPQAAVAAAAPLIVKVDGTLPSNIELEPGQQVIFVRHKRLVGSNVSVQELQFDRMAPALFQKLNNVQIADPDYYVVAAYSVTRVANGAVDVTHTPVVPRPRPTTQRISVTVQAAQLQPVVVNVDQPLPARIVLKKGQRVLFVRNKHLVGTSVEVKATQTDRGIQGLFNSASGAAVGAQFYLVGGYEATRVGYGRVDVRHKVVYPGSSWTTKSIEIIVR